jgi:homoserine/homoserine lactone efflux protein
LEFSVWLALVGLFLAGGLSPGPAVFLIVNSAIRYDFPRAMIAATGISTANLVWLGGVATGALAILSSYPVVLTVLKFIGAGVIAFMGLRAVFAPIRRLEADGDDAPKKSRLWGQGVLLQLANPGALVYFVLLLPTFLSTDHPLLAQIAIIAVTVTITEMFGLAVYAAGARGLLRFLNDAGHQRLFNLASGSLMVASAGYALWVTR